MGRIKQQLVDRSDDDNLRLRCAELGAELEEKRDECEALRLDLHEMTKQCERALLRAGESAEKSARIDAALRDFLSYENDTTVIEAFKRRGLWRDPAPQPQEKAL